MRTCRTTPRFADLEAACEQFCVKVSACRHRESGRVPDEAPWQRNAPVCTPCRRPRTPGHWHWRGVGTDQTIRFGSVWYSRPPGLFGTEVWVRAASTELVVAADLDALPQARDWVENKRGFSEVVRHLLSTSGNPRIDPVHYPDHPQEPGGAPKSPVKARSADEPLPRPRARSAHLVGRRFGGRRGPDLGKMTAVVELAAFVGAATVDLALASWNASVLTSARMTCPVITTIDTESICVSAIAVTKLVAPGPEVAIRTPLARCLGVTDCCMTCTLVMA